jgi:D-erythrulose 1-phosphate 3-epimerase
MKLGLNLSFATKRWQSPEYLAKLVKNELGVRLIQFTWDLIDPWWPEAARDRLAGKYRERFEKEGLKIVSSFGGLASYTFPQLLSKEKDQREISFCYFKRAIDMASALGVDVIGTPLGGMSDGDSRDPEVRRRLYKELLDYLAKLSLYAKDKGLKKILIEPTPLSTEIPSTPEESNALMADLKGNTAIPIALVVDWGHAVFKPLLKDRARVDIWIEQCAEYIDSYHLQQSDGKMDCHWSFSKKGIFDEEMIRRLCTNPKVPIDTIGFLELLFPFEMTNVDVMKEVKYSLDYLSRFLDV